MTDIYTIKNLLYFVPYLKTETWYMLGIGIVVYAIYIAYLIAFERYYASQAGISDIVPQKTPILQSLSNLRIEDECFFEKLSFIIRSHLEDSEQVPLATKKTPQDIRGASVSRELQEILDICTHYEYAPDEADKEVKIEIFRRLRGVV